MNQTTKRNMVIVLVFVVFWQIASMKINKSLFMPSPEETLESLEGLIKNGTLLQHIGASFGRITAGVMVATCVSVPLGMVIAWVKFANRWFYPIIVAMSFIPVTCFSVLLVLYLGIGELMKIVFIAIAVSFSMLPSVIQTCQAPNDKLKETAYTMGFSYPRMLWYCMIPYIMPNLINLIINGYSVGWNYVILAELTNTVHGLGHLMHVGKARGNTAMVFASMLILVCISFVFTKVCKILLGKRYEWWEGKEGKNE